jgi:hypothetical protein
MLLMFFLRVLSSGICHVESGESQLTFQKNILPPSSGLKSKPRKKPGWSRALLAVCFMLVLCLAYSSAVKMVICFSETLVDFHQTTQHYILQDRVLHSHCCENLKSCNILLFLHFFFKLINLVFQVFPFYICNF